MPGTLQSCNDQYTEDNLSEIHRVGTVRWLSAQKGLLCKLESLRSDTLAKATNFRFVESSYLKAVRQVAAIEENTQCAALASACAHKRTYAGTLADSCARSTSMNRCT